jgi:hypothetical protein
VEYRRFTQGVDIVTRQHGARSSDFRRGQRLGKGDHLIDLIKPPKPTWMDIDTYEKIPNTLKLREVKTGHVDDDGKDIIIVTTLIAPEKYSKTELIACSKQRWNVEIDLRSMKTIMGMDILSCKTPEMIKKEIWTYILVYNLVRQLITRASIEHKLQPRQISFTGAIQTFLAFLPLFYGNPTPTDSQRYFAAMLKSIAYHRIGNRPYRREPRAVKRRSKPFPKLKVSRRKAKEMIGGLT